MPFANTPRTARTLKFDSTDSKKSNNPAMDEGNTRHLVGVGHSFHNFSDWVTFRLYENGEFHFHELDSLSPEHDDCAYRGRCELIQ